MEISTLNQQFLYACSINNFKKVIELLEQGEDEGRGPSPKNVLLFQCEIEDIFIHF
jgi:hypothetical protein